MRVRGGGAGAEGGRVSVEEGLMVEKRVTEGTDVTAVGWVRGKSGWREGEGRGERPEQQSLKFGGEEP